MPARDGDECDSLGVIADLFDESGGFLHDFVETVFTPLRSYKALSNNWVVITNLGGVHLVDGNDELPDTQGEGKESVLASLAILGDTGLELTGTTGDDEDSAVSLGGTSDHVLDEITVARGVNDLRKGRPMNTCT